MTRADCPQDASDHQDYYLIFSRIPTVDGKNPETTGDAPNLIVGSNQHLGHRKWFQDFFHQQYQPSKFASTAILGCQCHISKTQKNN